MAFFKGSYYESIAVFDDPEDGSDGFRGIRARPVPSPEPVLEHSVSVGDRLDQISQHYYANPRDWRRVADCNPDTLFAEDLVYDPDIQDDVAREDRGARILIPRRREGQR